MARKKKIIVRIDNIDTLQDLMQEVYHDACGQIIDAQNTINSLVNGSVPQDTDDFTKIAKAKTDALKVKDSAIKIKLDVGRLQNDIIKNNGSLTEEMGKLAIDKGEASLDTFSQLRKLVEAEKKKNEK